jgi:folate-binding protein YgfZ
MYVLRAKAKLSDVSDEFVRIGLSGDRTVQQLESAQLPVPPQINAVATHGDTRIIRLHGQRPRFLILGPADAVSKTWTLLTQAGIQPAGEDQWMLRKLLAGEPTIYPETSEHFVAQMIGLEELDAINFRKGCYIGQEIIARAHFRGTVKRHMVHARSASRETIRPGMAIISEANQQPVAEVVDARRQADDSCEMLIVIQDDHLHDRLQLQDSGGALAIVAPD